MSVKRYTWSTEDHAMRESHELGDFVRLADYEAAIADGDLRYENGQRNERLANQDRIRELETALIAVLAQPENPTIWFGVVRGCFKSETPAKHGDGISPQMIGPMEKRMVNEDTIRQIAKQTLPNSSFNIMLAEIDRLRAALRGEDPEGHVSAVVERVQLRDRVQALEAEIADHYREQSRILKLEAALREYGWHKGGCAGGFFPGGCTCGFIAAFDIKDEKHAPN